jgi:arabinan endo-1,5-alpha-L-arabinosidase
MRIVLTTLLISVAMLLIKADERLFIFRKTGALNAIPFSVIDSIKVDTVLHQLQLYRSDSNPTNILINSIDSLTIDNAAIPSYSPPTYADDYSAISSYTRRHLWHMANVHDPTVVKHEDYFYMTQTDASYGNVLNGRGHYPMRRSRDLVYWEFMGFAMPQTPPSWIKDSLNSIRIQMGLPTIANPIYGYWAPVMRKVGNTYRIYYSVIVDNYIKTGLPNTAANFDNSWVERAFIGMMETETPQFVTSWKDKGYVIHSSTDRGLNFYRASLNDWSGYFKWNAIDPTYQITPEGDHYLIYGSWHSGIVSVPIDPESGKLKKQPLVLADFGTRIARRQNNDNNRWQAQEGPEIIYNPETGYYYLFLAYDELSVAYNTRVCRSRNINGPYYGYNGANITNGADCWPIITHPYKFNNHSGWVGFAHCAVFQDPEDGQWYYASQARLPENTGGNPYSNAIMMGHIRKILWTDDGWPVVLPQRYAAVPQTVITDEDLAGTWEHIHLGYSYRNQFSSVALHLSPNYVVTGAMQGFWSYNAHTKTLTIRQTGGTQIRLKVERELDWEATPRRPTIVYTGLNSSGHSLWGKKIN